MSRRSEQEKDIACMCGYQIIKVHTPDTDVFLIMLSFLESRIANVYGN